MTRFKSTALAFALASGLACGFGLDVACAAAAADTELRFRSGQTWRGELNQQVEVEFVEGGRQQTLVGTLVRADSTMVVVEAVVSGRSSRKTIFFGDIRAMRTISADAGDEDEASTAGSSASGGAPASAGMATPGKDAPEQRGDFQGVIVLPIEGTVGLGVRDEDITAIGKEADKFGPGQIIILEVNSPGGSIVEAGKIHLAMKELRKRHRVVAWIKEAISAAAFTAMHCDEIYFMTPGTMGSMTGFNSGTGIAISGRELQSWLDLAAEVAADSGRDANMALCMIQKDRESSVDIPEGGGPKDAVWRNDAKGQIVVDSKDTMLCFNASNALAVGVSDGTADTTTELARLLDLPEWKELTDVGRRMHANHQRNIKLSETELPKLMARFEFKGEGSGDPAVVMGSRIQVLEELIRWWDRCAECCMMRGLPPKDELKFMIDQIRQQLGQMRRNNQRGTGR